MGDGFIWACSGVYGPNDNNLRGQLWDKRVLEKLEVMVGQFSVSVRWHGLGDGFIWACSGVYGPNDNNLRGQMWDELIGIQQL